MTMNGENYIRFDWAMKRLLRNKANYVVLGSVSCLHYLERNLRFTAFSESESNQEDEDDKYNRVDIRQKAKTSSCASLKYKTVESKPISIACSMEFLKR